MKSSGQYQLTFFSRQGSNCSGPPGQCYNECAQPSLLSTQPTCFSPGPTAFYLGHLLSTRATYFTLRPIAFHPGHMLSIWGVCFGCGPPTFHLGHMISSKATCFAHWLLVLIGMHCQLYTWSAYFTQLSVFTWATSFPTGLISTTTRLQIVVATEAAVIGLHNAKHKASDAEPERI